MFKQRRCNFCRFAGTILAVLWLSACTIPTVVPESTDPTESTAATALPPVVATLVAETPPQEGESLPSPDGQWRADVIIYPCTDVAGEGEVSYEQLILWEVATDVQTEIARQQINCGGLGAYGLAPLCWSGDSRYLYFTDAREGVPDGAGEWQRPIVQADTTTGESVSYSGELVADTAEQPVPVACQ